VPPIPFPVAGGFAGLIVALEASLVWDWVTAAASSWKPAARARRKSPPVS
jgi:hypothetical protein